MHFPSPRVHAGAIYLLELTVTARARATLITLLATAGLLASVGVAVAGERDQRCQDPDGIVVVCVADLDLLSGGDDTVWPW